MAPANIVFLSVMIAIMHVVMATALFCVLMFVWPKTNWVLKAVLGLIIHIFVILTPTIVVIIAVTVFIGLSQLN